ncbi:MAG: type II toxin-antitoxin system VapC family toxin [Leptolyngbya sp. SIOISBB]|nr:type II toxin-antitoxin system VapC family toxin [Leptolyngbya sp. SIOISBB]
MRMVFDSSVIMAILRDEPGRDVGEKHLEQAMLSIVNYAEVTSILGRSRPSTTALKRAVQPFEPYVVAINTDIAQMAGALVAETKELGLSLGDRVCLALGISHNLPILTADKTWSQLDLPIEVNQIR